MTFLSHQHVRIFEALAALRLLAERRIDRLGIALVKTRRAAEFALPDGIADADVHSNRLLEWSPRFNANGLQ